MGGTQPDSTEIKSGLLPRFPGRRACEVNLSCYRACFVVWLVVVRTGVWTALSISCGFCRIHHSGVLRWAAGWRLAGACGGSAGGLKLRWTTECMCWLDAAIASLGSTRTARRHASPGGGLEAPSEPSAQRLREGVRACGYGHAATSEALRACRPNGWGRPERLERWRGEGRPWRSVTRSPRSTGWFCSGVAGANRGCGIGSWSR